MSSVDDRTKRGDGAAFLLAQIGAHAAVRFAERLREHDLTPALVGVLRLLRIWPGQSQQALSERLGLLPSRLVPLVDDLEARGLVRRQRSRTDRRVNVIELTPAGAAVLGTIRTVAQDHESSLLSGLDEGEQAVLTAMLRRIATQQGLTPLVHPGYRTLDSKPEPLDGADPALTSVPPGRHDAALADGGPVP